MQNSKETFLVTERLEFSLLQTEDQEELQRILGDPEIMYAWEHGFSAAEVKEWLEENQRRYERDGYSYWAVRRKSDGSFIGVMGIMKETAAGKEYTGIGYILDKRCWKQGYAAEGAAALVTHAFCDLGIEVLTAQIRVNNLASQKVAAELGMQVEFEFTKVYQGKVMPHLLYMLKAAAWMEGEH